MSVIVYRIEVRCCHCFMSVYVCLSLIFEYMYVCVLVDVSTMHKRDIGEYVVLDMHI